MSNPFITIKQAAAILGVSTLTLRNWDKNGKLKAYRHPINNYRVYKTEDLENMIKSFGTEPKNIENAKNALKRIVVQHLKD